MQLLDILAQKLPIEMIAVDPGEVIERADKHDLANYDTNILWVVEKLNGVLVTLDQNLLKAAGKNNLKRSF
jgi:predicted nucleic acid-binding protein